MEKIRNLLMAKSVGLYINILSYVYPSKASALAYKFFSEPRVGRLSKDNLPSILKEAETATFSLNEHQLQTYTWTGNQQVILLVHGWESNASRWEKLLPYLKKTGSTIIALDGPAHGLSSGKEFTVPRYAEFIDAVVKQYQPAYLIGHSIGGAACVYYQYRYQNPGLQKMILLGAPSDLKTLIANYVSLLGLNGRMMQSLEKHFWDKFQLRLEDFSAGTFASQLQLNGLIVHDIEDDVVAFAEGKKIAGSWSNATFIETKGLGHSMHDDELYLKLSRFLSDAE